MNRMFSALFVIVLLFSTSCVGLVVTSGERIDLNRNCDKSDFYYHCQSEPDKIRARFGGEPKRKYLKKNKEYWVYERQSRRGILLGAIIPIPIYIPWTDDTIFEFEDGKRTHTSIVRTNSYGLLCGILFSFEGEPPLCAVGKMDF